MVNIPSYSVPYTAIESGDRHFVKETQGQLVARPALATSSLLHMVSLEDSEFSEVTECAADYAHEADISALNTR